MRLISQANKHCPPQGGTHAAREAALSKANQMETSGAMMVAQPLTAMISQTPAKKALLPCRLQAPAKLWHFSCLHGSSRVPLPPLPMLGSHPLPPGCILQLVVPCCWVALGRGTPVRGQRGCPSSQPTVPASSAAGTAWRPKKCHPGNPAGQLVCFSLLWAERRGWKRWLHSPGVALAVAPGLAHMACVHVPLPKWLRRDGCPCVEKGSLSPGCRAARGAVTLVLWE